MEIRFGPFLLDLAGRQLRRDRQRVPLSPKVYQLLCVLAEERPRAVSRQELHARLWPDTFVSDVNLACLVGELRSALGEWRHLVRTVHRFGYAFDLPSPGTATEGSVKPEARHVVLVLPITTLEAGGGGVYGPCGRTHRRVDHPARRGAVAEHHAVVRRPGAFARAAGPVAAGA